MTPDQMKAFYRRYNACCNDHNFAALDEFVAEDVRVNNRLVGLTQYKRSLERTIEAFPDYRWHLEQLIVEGEWLSARFTDTGTHRGKFLCVAPTGKPVRTMEFDEYRVVKGKIAEVWGTADNLTILTQLLGMTAPEDV
jgi:predicted ester cyclase